MDCERGDDKKQTTEEWRGGKTHQEGKMCVSLFFFFTRFLLINLFILALKKWWFPHKSALSFMCQILKGALCSFGEGIQTNTYNVNEVTIQTNYLSFP